MLRSFKKCCNAITKGDSKKRTIGNFKVERDEKLDSLIYIYHYGNCVAAVNLSLKKIGRSQKWWNYSMSTKRLCNDIIRYFDGYRLI